MAWSFSYFFDSFKDPLPWKVFNDPTLANSGMWCEDNDANKQFFLGAAITESDFDTCKMACINNGEDCA